MSFLHGWRSHLRADHLADTTMKRRRNDFLDWHIYQIRATEVLAVFIAHFGNCNAVFHHQCQCPCVRLLHRLPRAISSLCREFGSPFRSDPFLSMIHTAVHREWFPCCLVRLMQERVVSPVSQRSIFQCAKTHAGKPQCSIVNTVPNAIHNSMCML